MAFQESQCCSSLCVLIILQLFLMVLGIAEIITLTRFHEITYLRFQNSGSVEDLEREVFGQYVRYFLLATGGAIIGWAFFCTLFIFCGCLRSGKPAIRIAAAIDVILVLASVVAMSLAAIRAQELEGPEYLSKIMKVFEEEIVNKHFKICTSNHNICIMMKNESGGTTDAQNKLLALMVLWLVCAIGFTITAFIKLLSKSFIEEDEYRGRYTRTRTMKPVVV